MSGRPVGGQPVRFGVRLTPRGGADRVEGVSDGVLRARVVAAAVEGAANEALLRLLARELGVARSCLRLVSGATGRMKVVATDGSTPEEIIARWPGLRV